MAKRSPITAALKQSIANLPPGDCDGLQALIETARFDPDLAEPLRGRPADEVADTLLRFSDIRHRGGPLSRLTGALCLRRGFHPQPPPLRADILSHRLSARRGRHDGCRFSDILRFTDTLYIAGDCYLGPWPDVTTKGYPKSRFISNFSRLPELVGRLSALDARLPPLMLACAKTRCEWNHDGLWALRHQPDNAAIRKWVTALARDRNEYRRDVGERILAVWETESTSS
ncbi:MAG: hypothetical protein ACI8RZ_004221 [Myxococcota bacterium]|jgi:hypothetical protein